MGEEVASPSTNRFHEMMELLDTLRSWPRKERSVNEYNDHADNDEEQIHMAGVRTTAPGTMPVPKLPF
ncbi:MAG TPA: hypothetical protein VGY98_14150 [Verrucomicrobiae bacterium]|nr:hypothetical protein [Verrucomicrobiae bacterium]